MSFLYSFSIISQETKNFDLIILVDEELATNISNVHLQVISQNDTINIGASYHPGNLSLPQKRFEQIMSDKTKTIVMSFNYFNSKSKNRLKHYSYRISYNKNWLKESFNILRIYNFDKRKYRKKYNPAFEYATFARELDFGWYSIIPLK